MKKLKPYIAPIVIAVVLLTFLATMAYGFTLIPNMELWLKIVLLLVPSFLCVVAIGAWLQRIKEIKETKDDDSSNY